MPAGNLLLVKTSDKEQVGRQDYDQQIARPVREFLEKKDTDERRIKCIVLVYGMPLRVLPPPPTTTENRRLQELQAVLKEKTEREKLAGKEHKGISKEIEDKWADLKKDIRRLSRTDWAASVDSELALVMEKTYDLEGWLPNRYFVDFHGKEIKNIPRRVILVSRVDGPTPAIVRRIIDDSIHAEKEGLSGKAYFDARWPEKSLPDKKVSKPSAYEIYDLAIHKAARIVRESKKLPVVLDERPELFGPGEAPDAALYCGWYSLGKYVDAFTWVRGAVGYHVASSECTTLKTPGSTVWCKAMLDKGIAATVGPVAEPYLQSFPAPGVFFGCLLDRRSDPCRMLRSRESLLVMATGAYRRSPLSSVQEALRPSPRAGCSHLFHPVIVTPAIMLSTSLGGGVECQLFSLPSVVAQYPVLQAIPISIVAIKVPSLIVLTLFALNPLMVSSS